MSLLLISAAACGEGGPPPLETRIDTVDGVVRVRNSGYPLHWWTAPRSTWTSGEEEGEAGWGGVSAILMDPDLRTYVADDRRKTVWVYRNAVLERRLRREGAGREGFGSLHSLAWVGESLLVLDTARGRIDLFDREGTWIGERAAAPTVPPFLGDVRFHPVGLGHVYVSDMRRGEGGDEPVFVLHTAEGAEDTIPAVRPLPFDSFQVRCRLPGGAPALFDNPFAPELMQVPVRNGLLATLRTDEYRIALLNAHGDTVRLIEREFDAPEVSDREWEDVLDAYRRFLDRTGASACEPDVPRRPLAKPFATRMAVDAGGRLWVEVARRDGRVFEVFDREGRLALETSSVPRNERVAPFLGGTWMLIAEVDSSGVESVVEIFLHGEPVMVGPPGALPTQ